MTNDSDPTPERRRYRRWSKDETKVRAGGEPVPEPKQEERLDLEALRSARAEDGLNVPITRETYTDFDGYEYEESEGALRNPYILAGLAVGAAIVLAVMVVVLFGGGGEAGPGGIDDPSLVSVLTPQPGENGRGISARTVAATMVREGPGTDFAQVATLPTGQEVEVVGRNSDSTWFQIYYPQGSQLKGWIPGTALRLNPEQIAQLAVASNTPIARTPAAQPTEPPAAPTAVPATPTPAPPAATPTPQGGGVDIAVAFPNPNCVPGTSLSVVIRNAGTAPLNRGAQVTISSAAGVVSTQSFTVDLPPGASMTLLAGVAAQPPRMTATISLLPQPNQPADANPGNNTAECTSGSGVPQPGVTAAPPATPTPVRPAVPLAPSATPRLPGG